MRESKTAPKQHKVIGKPFLKGKSGNPSGRPKGSLNFNTAFDSAVLKLAKKGTISDYEEKIVSKGIKMAEKGDFRFWNAIIERRFGKVKDTKTLELENKKSEKLILTFSEEEMRDFK